MKKTLKFLGRHGDTIRMHFILRATVVKYWCKEGKDIEGLLNFIPETVIFFIRISMSRKRFVLSMTSRK